MKLKNRLLSFALAALLLAGMLLPASASFFTDAHGNVIELDDSLQAYSSVELYGADNAARKSETNLGDLWADALRWFAVSGKINEYFEEDDIAAGNTEIIVDEDHIVALWNGGNLRADIPVGVFGAETLAKVLPYPNKVAVVYMTGAQLTEALEAASQALPYTDAKADSLAALMQVSGLSYTVNIGKSFKKGEAYGKNWFRAESLGRVTINEINSKPVDTGALYAVITSNANYNGMDSSYIFKEAVEDNDRCAITTAIVRDVVWMYVNEALNNYVSAEYQAPQNRITCVGRVFDDVPADHFAFDAISWAAENGIAAGVTETTFEPARICTRAEAVGYLWMANGAPISAEPLMFSDLTEDDAITPAAVWASEMGISNGTGNGKFSPDMAMTRGQIVTMLYRAAGMPEVKDASGFDDVAEGMYYADAAAWAVAQGITNGVGDNKFAPDVICTHAEIITMLYRELAK